MGFTPLSPGGTVRRLRREPGFINIGQFNLTGMGLSNQFLDVASCLLESFWIPFFFKL